MLDFAFGELALKPDEFWSLTWGEYYRMIRGYNRRIEHEQTNLGKLLFMIDTTKARSKGSPIPKLDDFLPQTSDSKKKEMTIEERQAIANERAKSKKSFDKGVVYSEV